jgi:hypothetical protein
MSTERDNRMVWSWGKPGHYEVWYATFNHRPSGTGFWIRYTLHSPQAGHGEPHGQLWFAYFNARSPERSFAINRKVPLRELRHEADPFALRLGGAELRHDSLQGGLEGDAHSASWDLAFMPAPFTHRHLPQSVYRHDFADTKVLSPNLMVNFNGTVTVDGETYHLDGEPGCQTHLWGRKHAHAWAWSHCNAFREDPTACLESLTVRLRRFGLVTPPLTFLSLYLGEDVFHFREFATLPVTYGRWETGLYKLRAVGHRVKLAGELRCRPEDLVRAAYTDPDGDALFCHNTEVADASLTVWTRRSLRSPFKRLCRLTSLGAAHFEYAGRAPDGHVTRRHVSVDPGPGQQ